MAEPMTSDDAFELKSVMQQILAQMKDSAAGTTEYSRRTSELIAHEELGRRATAAATTATNNNTASMKSLASTMASFGKNLEKLGASLNKTQNDFGISLASAAKLQVTAFKDSINSFVKLFTSIDYSQLFSEIGEVGAAVADMATNAAKDFASGKGVANAFTEGGKKIGEVLTKERPGPKPGQVVLPGELKEATKKFQAQFGVINTEFGAQIAQDAKDLGLSVDQLVEARRIFATTAMGDLNKVAGIQSRFFDQFKAKGMTPKIALEAITKYSELIARNGNRFAGSFARAAADAKLIGIDLNKVSQFGDSVISDFEGFLEKTAELGAMGFNLDSSRLAEISESGSDADLFNELRSQLAATGKDITKLRRSERLALEGMFGMTISEMQRLGGDTPKATSLEDYAEEGNNLLGKILALMIAGGPILSMLNSAFGAGSSLVEGVVKLAILLGPQGAIALALATLAAYASWKMGSGVASDIEKDRKEGEDLISKGFFERGTELIQRSFAKLANTNRVNTSGAYDDLTGSNNKALLDALEEAGKVSKQAKDKYIMDNSGTVRMPKLPTPSSESQWKMQAPTFTPNIPNSPILNPTQILRRAEGGLVTGPGTATSDSIPARLSNGEFVLNANATSKIGLNKLNQLNSFKPQSTYATGTAGTGKKTSFDPESLFKSVKDTTGIVGKTASSTMDIIRLLSVEKDALQSVQSTKVWNTAAAKAPTFRERLGVLKQFKPEYTKKLAQSAPFVGPWADKVFGNSKFAPSKVNMDIFKSGKLGLLGKGMSIGETALKKINPLLLGGELALKAGKGDYLGATEAIAKWIIGKATGTAAAGLTVASGLGTAGSTALLAPTAGVAGDMAGQYATGKMFDGIRWALEKGKETGAGWSKASNMKRYHKGGIAGGASDELPAILQRGEAVISRLQMGGLNKIISGMNSLSAFGDKFTTGTTGLKDKVGGMFGGKASRAMSGVSNLLGSESPIGGMMGLASKIPGVGGLLGKATELLSGGGLKGMAGSLLGKVGLGSLGGSLLGGPATMLGSLAAPLLKKIPFIGGAASALAGGPSKLLGKLGGSALGKIGGLFGKKKESVANMLPPQMQAILSGGQPGMEGVNFSAMLSQMMGSRQQQQSPPAAAPEIDTRGIEQKLNNFITALQGIQINMDGAQVGKVLVNFSDVAGTTGILRPRSSATF